MLMIFSYSPKRRIDIINIWHEGKYGLSFILIVYHYLIFQQYEYYH